MPNSRPVRLAAFAALLLPITLPAADIVIAPPATGGVAITNAAGSTTRLRVGDDGVLTMPGLGAVPLPATGLCLEVATGRLGTCTVGTLTSIVAGTGLTGGTITATGTIGIAAAYQLPQSCTNGQVPASNGAGAWACATPATGGGTVTAVTASAPLASSGGTAPVISLGGGTLRQVLAWTGAGPAWVDNVSLNGNLALFNSTATVGNITKNGALFLHSMGTNSVYAGAGAGNATTTGFGNAAFGQSAMNKVTTGGSNTALGNGAFGNSTAGSFNVIVGAGAGLGSTMGDFNTVVGTNAFGSTTTAFQNTGLGGGVLNDVTSGSGNIALGYASGAGITDGNFNISIGRGGSAGINESGVIRIGNFLHSKTFIAGISGVTTDVNDAVGVMIASNGQLGTVSSSRRYKEDIDDMGEASEGLMHLRPVTFHYKSDSDPSGKRLQYGLVAEEVAAVYPGLVARTPDGQSETVMYHFLAPMLVNEVQKQQRTIEAQREELGALRAELADIKRALGLAR